MFYCISCFLVNFPLFSPGTLLFIHVQASSLVGMGILLQLLLWDGTMAMGSLSVKTLSLALLSLLLSHPSVLVLRWLDLLVLLVFLLQGDVSLKQKKVKKKRPFYTFE